MIDEVKTNAFRLRRLGMLYKMMVMISVGNDPSDGAGPDLFISLAYPVIASRQKARPASRRENSFH